jgi:hypothetical protein
MTNVSAAVVTIEWQPVGWSIKSSESTLEHDLFCREIEAAGITLFHHHPIAEPPELQKPNVRARVL